MSRSSKHLPCLTASARGRHHRVRNLHTRSRRDGFTLLEMLLSLAILGGSLAVLSQIGSTGTDAAIEARELASCRVLAQSKSNEVMLDTVTTPVSVPASPLASFDSGSINEYQYTVDVQPGMLDGLLIVRVLVESLNPDSDRPLARYALDRMMVDPALGLADLEAEEQALIDEAEAASAEAAP